AELNSELLGDPRHPPVLGERVVHVPQVGTNDGVSARVAIGTKWRGYEAVGIEPDSVQLPEAGVEIASGTGIRPRGRGAEAVVNAVGDRADRERSSRKIGVASGNLPAADHASKKAAGLERKI